MRLLRNALWPAGLALGIAAEWVAYNGEPARTAADGLVGFTLIACGLIAWGRRSNSGAGPIIAAAGFAWFFGTFGGWALYLHRGPLAHLLLSYPGGRPRSRLERAAVAVAYSYAAIRPIAANDYVTIGVALGLVAVAAHRYGAAGGPERRARQSALLAALPFGSVLVLSAAIRLRNADVDPPILEIYEAVTLVVGLGLTANLLWGRWAQATVTGLVVNLGKPGSAGSLRERLARALGDPTLAIAYFLSDVGRYVDEAGEPFELPASEERREVTPLEEDGNLVAALVHDAAVLDDRELIASVTAIARLAVSNARLQADVRARVAEVEASRVRIVQAADAQSRRLERTIREGAERRLARMAELLESCGPPLAEVRRDLHAARSDVREFARGIHPAVLTDRGLAPALAELAKRSPVPVTVDAPLNRWQPAVEAAAYFVCSEALTNAAKHARASRVTVLAEERAELLRITVADDGVGGADGSTGSGLRGLADRIEALGGHFHVASQSGRGTRVVAEILLR